MHPTRIHHIGLPVSAGWSCSPWILHRLPGTDPVEALRAGVPHTAWSVHDLDEMHAPAVEVGGRSVWTPRDTPAPGTEDRVRRKPRRAPGPNGRCSVAERLGLLDDLRKILVGEAIEHAGCEQSRPSFLRVARSSRTRSRCTPPRVLGVPEDPVVPGGASRSGLVLVEHRLPPVVVADVEAGQDERHSLAPWSACRVGSIQPTPCLGEGCVAYDPVVTDDQASERAPAADAAPVLLAGGNPQIAKADGDAPVQAYIAAMPGWKHDVGRRLDALIVRAVPDVQKAVKWNSPFYGIEGQGWFLNFHCFTKYVKVAFFRGASLRPAPARRVQEQGRALPRHPRGRRARRGSCSRAGSGRPPSCPAGSRSAANG